MIEARLRTKIPPAELEQKVGKLVTDEDYNLLLTRATKLLKPDGKPLCIYLPGAVATGMDQAYPTLRSIRMKSDNRGVASGTKRVSAGGTRTRAMPIHSGVLGAMDPAPNRDYCRLTAYSREHVDRWEGTFGLLAAMSGLFEKNVPERFRNQQAAADRTHGDWLVPGTVFTTITVNNTYATGVHTDKGDLHEGFSCLAVSRKGHFNGGRLTFPEYRVAVDMSHGDLILMDAHEWHGNTKIICACSRPVLTGACPDCGAERISVVAYYRTQMTQCASAPEEQRKRDEWAERRATSAA